jgi:hypothetical protein
MYSYIKGNKTCRTCGEEKDYRSYYKAAGNANGYENQCKPCKNNSRDPEKRRAYIKAWRANKVALGHYGKCANCNESLGRDEGNRRKTEYCRNCLKGELNPNYKGGYINGDGYRVIHVGNRKTMLEHRCVMEKWLGRKLFGDENVHHMNGDRLDNRIENLELWSTMQPSGQRVSDKIVFAKEILKRYEQVQEPITV